MTNVNVLFPGPLESERLTSAYLYCDILLLTIGRAGFSDDWSVSAVSKDSAALGDEAKLLPRDMKRPVPCM